MAQPKTKRDLTRLSWLAALRRDGDRQCHGELCLFVRYPDGRVTVDKVCALGLLGEVSGVTAWWDADIADIAASAGLTPAQTDQVVFMNDGTCTAYRKHTFAEIANVVAGWFDGRRV